MLFGLSAGNLLTLPALVIQREFEAASFGMLVGLSWAISQFTYAFGPGLIGVIRDVTGNYAAPLVLCGARSRRRRADPAAAGGAQSAVYLSAPVVFR